MLPDDPTEFGLYASKIRFTIESLFIAQSNQNTSPPARNHDNLCTSTVVKTRTSSLDQEIDENHLKEILRRESRLQLQQQLQTREISELRSKCEKLLKQVSTKESELVVCQELLRQKIEVSNKHQSSFETVRSEWSFAERYLNNLKSGTHH